jgi:hypothetical protein
MDLEGIVAKHSFGPYVTQRERTPWLRNYMVQDQKSQIFQMEGREQLFDRERHQETVPGWHSCDLVCAEAEP